MKPLPFKEIDDFEPAEISVSDDQYIKVLFTNLRIDRETLPEGSNAYDIREGNSDAFSSVEPIVRVNHTGTVVTREKIPMLIKSEHGEYSDIKSFGFDDEESYGNDWRKPYLKY